MTTKTIDSTALRNNFGNALKAVKQGETLLIRKRGKLQAALIDLDTLEDYLACQDPEYRKGIRKARKSNELYAPEEVFGELWNEV